MKAHLLYPDRDLAWRGLLQAAAERTASRAGRRYQPKGEAAPRPASPWNAADLVRDLDIHTLVTAMAGDDDCVFQTAKSVILSGVVGNAETIRYRQEILRDCLEHPDVLRALYRVAAGAAEAEKKHYLSSLLRSPDWILRWAIELIEALLDSVEELRKLADANADGFDSAGWTRFFKSVREELNDAYVASIQRHLARLRFKDGVLFSACFGAGDKGAEYKLHAAPRRNPRPWAFLERWLPRLFTAPIPPSSFSVHPRDESGVRALSELQNRAIAIAADALGRSAHHIRDFFGMLQVECSFYIGCLNLYEKLEKLREPIATPATAPSGEKRLAFRGLYDVCLALNRHGQVVGNDVNAEGKDLIVVTGANRGGKSTFLRSIGLAQLMMQCGMFVPAEAFYASLGDGLFTHFQREEDVAMESGKFDEELTRMSAIVDHLGRHPIILLNESLAATNEHEGSEIASQIVTALLEKSARMVFVTHLFEFASTVHGKKMNNVMFLRADRRADGSRTFKLIEAGPLETSYGEDLYRSVFGTNNEG